MSPQQQDAHLRLMAILPKTTHYLDSETEYNAKARTRERPLIVRGKRYDSLEDAMRATRRSKYQIYRMMRDRQAKYL